MVGVTAAMVVLMKILGREVPYVRSFMRQEVVLQEFGPGILGDKQDGMKLVVIWGGQ